MPNDVPLLGNGNIKKISLLGSTGSIGTQTLDIAEEHPDKFEIVALSAGRNLDVARVYTTLALFNVLRFPLIRFFIDALYSFVSKHRYTISK
mgnify:CR=1 FL=1